MNLESLITRVGAIVQDSNFGDAEITEYLNRGMLVVAGGIRRADSSVITQPLPLLYEIGTVSTSTSTYKVDLPVDYQRDLIFAVDEDGDQIQILDSFLDLVRSYPALDESGDIVAVAVKGKSLYYQGIPTTSEAITIHYHRYPVDMIVGTDEPDGLPPEFHESVLVNYACKEIYALKEDGIDGATPNMNKYEGKFQLGIDALEASIAAETPQFSFFA